jgi:hypothetical protein
VRRLVGLKHFMVKILGRSFQKILMSLLCTSCFVFHLLHSR